MPGAEVNPAAAAAAAAASFTMAPAGMEATFNKQPRFTGTATRFTPVSSDDYTPTQFVRQIEIRQRKFGWTDELTMSHVKSMFQSKAADWLFQGLLTQKSQPVWDIITSKWSLFLPVFKAKYGITDEIRNISLSAIDGQRKTESALDYLDRTMQALHDFRFLQMQEGERAPVGGVGALAVKPVSAQVVAKLEGNREMIKDIDDALANSEYRAAHYQFNKLLGAFAMRLLSHGFTSLHLRQEAARILRSGPDLDTFVTEMEVIVHQQEVPQQRTVKVAEVSDHSAVSDKYDDESVDAISQDSKKKESGGNVSQDSKRKESGGNGNNGHGRNTAEYNSGHGRNTAEYKNNLKCHFCKRKGHFIRECRTRLAAEAGKANSAAPPTVAPPVAAAHPPLAAISAPLPGNSNGPW